MVMALAVVVALELGRPVAGGHHGGIATFPAWPHAGFGCAGGTC
jgi:hypothetical protein